MKMSYGCLPEALVTVCLPLLRSLSNACHLASITEALRRCLYAKQTGTGVIIKGRSSNTTVFLLNTQGKLPPPSVRGALHGESGPSESYIFKSDLLEDAWVAQTLHSIENLNTC